MSRRIIGIAVALENGVPCEPPGHEPQIDHISHRQPAGQKRCGLPEDGPGLESNASSPEI